MPSRRAGSWLLAAYLLLAPSLAAAAEPAPAPAPVEPEDREIPPDRGSLHLLEKEYRQVINKLKDPTTPLDKRIEVVGVFALTRDKRAVPDLVSLVMGKKEPIDLRVAALWALGEIGDPRGIPALQYALGQIYLKDKDPGKDPEWKYEKGITLDEKKPKVSLQQMCEERLGSLAEPFVPKFAQMLLAPVTSGVSEPQQAVETPQTGKLRAALVSLAAVGDHDLQAVKTLGDVLRADDKYYPWDFKIIAAQALSTIVQTRQRVFAPLKIHDKMADMIGGAFIEAVAVTDIPEVREIIGWTLRQMGWADRAGKTLAGLLETPNLPKNVRYRIVESLAFIQSKAAADQLIFLTYDPDRNVRWRAAVALGATGDERAPGFLRKLIRDPDAFVRTKAIAALGHLEDPKSIPDLAVAVADEDYHVRRQAALALGRTGKRQGIPALVQALRDSHPSVRAMAVIGLGYIGRAEGLKPVVPLITDPDPGVRLVAVQVLDKFLNPGATNALLAALGDSEAAVRKAATGSIKARLARNAKDTLPPLAEAIAKGKGDARIAALECVAADYRNLKAAGNEDRQRLYERLLRSSSRPLAAALIASLSDEKPRARELAGDILAEHAWGQKDKDLLERVAALADDKDVKVRTIGLRAKNYLRNLP